MLTMKINCLEGEQRLYQQQLEDLTKENDELLKKINELKNYEDNIKELEKIKDEYEKELENSKNDLEKAHQEIHHLRNQIIEHQKSLSQIEELNEKIEIIDKEKAFMIENTIYFKEEMAKNYNFYNEELEKTKKQFIEMKIQHSHILMEKEYLDLRCKELENILKQNKK